MSNNRVSKGSTNSRPVRKQVNSTYSKTRDNYKARDKPKYNSGNKPKSSARDRGIDNPKRRRPNNRINTRSEGKSNQRTNYRTGGGSSGRYGDRESNNRSSSGSRNRSGGRPRQEFEAVCSSCLKKTTLPFKPMGNKPVYCRECFQDHKPSSNRTKQGDNRPNNRTGGRQDYRSRDGQRSRYDNRTRDRSGGRPRQDFPAICSVCKKETTLPFKPTGVKPVFCRECYTKQKAGKNLTPKPEEDVERFGDRDGPYRENKRMHKTHCRQCNDMILVPFKPTKNKLIYCPDCYEKIKKED